MVQAVSNSVPGALLRKPVETLAIFSGQPAFDRKLCVGRPNIGSRDQLISRINDILDRKWLTNNGVYVHEFQRRLADMLGVGHCVAVCNGTIALEIAIRALGLSHEVIVPSFTFVATAHALRWLGITPVFCDVDLQTHNIDPAKVEERVTPRTTGIIGVHLWGRPCDTDALESIAHRHNLKLMFDAAHALGCSHNGRMVGGFGDAEVFSLHATKFCNSFEGGVVAANNPELADRVRRMKNFGFVGLDSVACLGTNGKMSEVAAAMGITSLDSVDDFIKANHRNYRRYQHELSGVPGLTMIAYDESERCNYQYVVVEVDEEVTRISRDSLLEVLCAENVIARRYFYPGCHRMEPYRSHTPDTEVALPETETLAGRVMVLPTGTDIQPDHIKTICRILALAVENGSEVTERLRAAESRSYG